MTIHAPLPSRKKPFQFVNTLIFLDYSNNTSLDKIEKLDYFVAMRHLVRDPIHFTIPMSADERKLVNHPLFQRLRRIRQTAFLNLVFPGATHDRFSHSIGVMHVAGLIFDQMSTEFQTTFGPRSMQPDQCDYFRRLLRVTALLHDIGHGPFSHSLEGVSQAGRPIHPTRKDYLDKGPIPLHWIAEKGSSTKQKWLSSPTMHEDFSIGLIAKIAGNNDRIAGVYAQDVAALLAGDWIAPTPELLDMCKVGPSGKWNILPGLRGIVSGELDADRMDYLLRDSHYTGVPYGQFDREMILGNMLWRPDPNKKNDLCICMRKKALRAFEDFLISRYHMFLQLYSHKTVVGFDIILENALAELPDFSILPDLVDYSSWSDEWLLKRILENRSSLWGTYIRDRIPLKYICTVGPDDQKIFKKFIQPYEISPGTTVWFPSLKQNYDSKSLEKNMKGVPKLWWRHCTSYLTKGSRGQYPIYVEDREKLIPMEKLSLLLKSNYMRRFELTHIFTHRGEESTTMDWLLKNGVPDSILAKPRSLVDHYQI